MLSAPWVSACLAEELRVLGHYGKRQAQQTVGYCRNSRVGHKIADVPLFSFATFAVPLALTFGGALTASVMHCHKGVRSNVVFVSLAVIGEGLSRWLRMTSGLQHWKKQLPTRRRLSMNSLTSW